LKLLSECSLKEKKQHNIVEETDDDVLMNVVQEDEILKPLSECLDYKSYGVAQED
jgi:hypothetical protein